MPIFKILNAEERRQFDSPPHFNGEERKKHFRLNKKLEGLLDTLRTPTTKVVFLLLYGYLQATGKLYSESIKDFNHDDVDFVAKSLVIPIENIQLDTYSKQKFAHHRSILLDNFGYLELTKEYEQGLREDQAMKSLTFILLLIIYINLQFACYI